MNIPPQHSAESSATMARGFSLIECLVYVAAFALVTSLAFSAYYRTSESSRLASRTANDITAAMRAGERWREDIRTATGRVWIVEADGGQMLHISNQSGGTLYRFANGALARQTNSDSGWATLLTGVKTSRMELDRRAKVSAWRWELELNARQKSPRVLPLFTFEAVPTAATQ